MSIAGENEKIHARGGIGAGAWLHTIRLDAAVGWRQLLKQKSASAAAIVSLALALGSSTAAFRLIDALLLRPLPIASPERLYAVAFEGSGVDGRVMTYDSCSYPMFERMRDAVRDGADAVAASYAGHDDLTFGSDLEIEKAYIQYVSGRMFPLFGLHAAAGRLLTGNDDLTPGAHPVAVLSYDYWTRRLGRDPKTVGRRFHIGDRVFEIVGVVDKPFSGTETGTVTEVFVPMMMKTPRTLASPNNFWLRTLVELKPGVAPAPVGEKLRAVFSAIQQEQARNGPPRPGRIPPREKMLFEPAAAGRSNLQRDYRLPLTALAVLVALVLLIACANVANLKTAQAAARGREMALRISIGAGRVRLLQQVIVESAWQAFPAAALGAIFAYWAAPFLASRIDSPDNPARLELSADWRMLAFTLALALAVTILLGLSPALRASSVKPVNALKGGDDPHARRRLMKALIALQAAFCIVVNFVAGLFVTSFDRLSHQSTGFSAARVLNLETVTYRPQAASAWSEILERLRATAGVESAALTIWPMMSGESQVSAVSVGGGEPFPMMCDILNVTPGWFDTLRIRRLDGRDFRPGDSMPGAAIVNKMFAKQYLEGANPVGKSFELETPKGRVTVPIVGFAADARSRDNLRIPIRPTAYFPFQSADPQGAIQPAARGTFVIRAASANPLALASMLRQEVPRLRPEFRVSNIRTQVEIEESKTVRERMLALLSLFFSAVALALAGVGHYGVLEHTVESRRREIGIRMAIGASGGRIARGVTADVLFMTLAGIAAGLALGIMAARYVASMLFEVRVTDWTRLAVPVLTMVAAAMLAAVPAALRAMRVDPASALRAE